MHRVAVIGAGTMGHVHTAGYANINNVELVGIVDTHEERGKSLAEARGTRYYPNFDELLAHETINLIDVCVPTPVHKQYVIRAARAKKHVICEKPLARTLEDATEMIEICKAEEVRFFVAHVVRFFQEYSVTQELIQQGEIGNVGTVRARRGGSFPSATEDWYASFEKSGGLIVDLMIHDFDYLRGVFGEVERVYTKSLIGREFLRLDHALVSLRFKNGVIAHVQGTWADVEGFYTTLEVAGTNGILTHDSREETAVRTAFRERHGGNHGVNVPESPVNKSPYQLELEHFLSCIESGRDPKVTPQDAYKALEISLAALKSAEIGEAVTLNEEEQR